MFWKMCEDKTVDELIKWKARSAIIIKEQGIDENEIIPMFNEIIELHIRSKEKEVKATDLYMLENKKSPRAQEAQKGR